MFAQILEFKPRPEKEVRYDVATAMGDLTYNLRKMGVNTFFSSRLEDKRYFVTAKCMFKGQEHEYTGVSWRCYSKAQLTALEGLHGIITRLVVHNAQRCGEDGVA